MLIPILLALFLAVPSPTAATTNEGRALRAALKSAERTIDDRVQQTTARAPFALLGQTRGAYLGGFGAVFTLEVNLVPVAGLSPFRPAYSLQEIQNLNRQKRKKLAVMKTVLRQLLVEQAAALGHLPLAEKIGIAVTLFNYNWEDTTGLPSQLVLQATRQSLLNLQARRPGPEALERAIEVNEF